MTGCGGVWRLLLVCALWPSGCGLADLVIQVSSEDSGLQKLRRSCTPWQCAQEDSSLTRSDAYFLDLIRRAGYMLLGSALQRNFPKGLYQVRRE